MEKTAEQLRLDSYVTDKSKWKKWGTYISDRAWATVREDYSSNGEVWENFPYEAAAARTYRWNEDGIGGFCDRDQRICFALALWNGKDPLLKERFFGLRGFEGNHGEDVKECYFYLDNTPTHSYAKMLYKFPQQAFPYDLLKEKNKNRGRKKGEFELIDTQIFEGNRYFDIFVEYAKGAEEDILIRYTLHNRAAEAAECYLLPTLWFRNTWSWGYGDRGATGDEKGKPLLQKKERSIVEVDHPIEGKYYLHLEGEPELLFTENETNYAKLEGRANATPYVKDAFHRYLIHQERGAINPQNRGTKCAALYHLKLEPGERATLSLRLNRTERSDWHDFDALLQQRTQEAEAFYAAIQPAHLTAELKQIQRLAFSGLLWNKQLYYMDLDQWRRGDPGLPVKREHNRNQSWTHLSSFDLFTVPDKWEYPYFCAWDTAFHCVPLALLDIDFAKRQIELLTREWYLHPNGQLPAYEWNFSDVNPPVLAWGAWRVYKMAQKHQRSEKEFLKGIFNKLLLNFTWWVNQEDREGKNVFQGGFLGLDNISIFDRSSPAIGKIYQSDATAWMAFYCILMMRISIHLALEEPLYQDIATKFFEHFLRIAHAMNDFDRKGCSLWDPYDSFFYDVLKLPNNEVVPLKVRSLVGLMPLLSVETFEPEAMDKLKIFSRRVDWFLRKNPQSHFNIKCIYKPGMGQRRLLTILTEERLIAVLKYLLDENEFLSPYGIRSLSKFHEKNPFTFNYEGQSFTVGYLPGESDSGLFGGNSNWRGPIWFPINFLIIESLQKFYHYYGDELRVEYPTGSGNYLNLWEVAAELSKRLMRLFTKDSEGKRPIYGENKTLQEDPHWSEHILFHEYFHGDTGLGLGASHQTGWTALIAKLIQQSGEKPL